LVLGAVEENGVILKVGERKMELNDDNKLNWFKVVMRKY